MSAYVGTTRWDYDYSNPIKDINVAHFTQLMRSLSESAREKLSLLLEERQDVVVGVDYAFQEIRLLQRIENRPIDKPAKRINRGPRKGKQSRVADWDPCV